MKLLVTGGCGFIGSNFLNLAFTKNFDSIMNIDSLTYAANQQNVKSDNQSNYEFHNIDITNKDLVEEAITEFQPNVIVHFAAESHVDNSISNPQNFINTNVIGTYNLIEVSRKYYEKNDLNNFHFIHISTDEVFGDLPETGFFKESTPYDPSSPYSASKAASDHLVSAWVRTYKFPATILNCSNNFGPNQHFEKLIPTIITKSFTKKQIPVYGNGLNVREWIFVEDYCNAVFHVIKQREKSLNETFCVGSGNELTNISIVEKICKIINNNYDLDYDCLELITFVEDRKGHDFRYAIDSSKIKKILNFSIETDFEEALAKTIEWYREKM
jgi:dTDP-glucose 4,6-dehydratase